MGTLNGTVRRAIKCVNPICHAIYGCEIGTTKHYCVDCAQRETCTIICVADVSGGICDVCFALLSKREGD
jgi:hypothetical protein